MRALNESRTAPPLISVCVVTRGRPALLDACLVSLQAQDSPPPFEVLVCADSDLDAVSTVLRRFPEAGVYTSEGRTPGAARNLLVERARGDILLFLDDDIAVPPGMLRRLGQLSRQDPGCVVFGGPNATPDGSSLFQRVQGEVLASIVGSGPVRRRYRASDPARADERSLTLCNLAVRRASMLPFDERLRCAEENALLAELGRRRAPMRSDPDLGAFHERRPTARAFGAQVYKYGFGRGQLTARDLRTLRPAFLAPVALLAYLVVALPLAAGAGGAGALVPAAAYGTLIAGASARIAVRAWTVAAGPMAVALFVQLHVSYAIGILVGFFTEAGHRRAPREPAALAS